MKRADKDGKVGEVEPLGFELATKETFSFGGSRSTILNKTGDIRSTDFVYCLNRNEM